MHVEEMAEAIGRAHGAALDAVTRALWAAVATGQVGDDDAARLSAAIAARKGLGKSVSGFKSLRVGMLAPKPRRSPERSEALERCRRWAAAGRMPPTIACKFTPGEQAALAVIALEVTKRQTCSMAIGAIAAIAGVSTSTVKRAIRQARALGLVTVQERRLSRYRNETNIVRIISREWLSWIEMRGSRGGVQHCTSTSTGDFLKRRERVSHAGQKVSEGPEGRPIHAPQHQGTSPQRANRR